MLCLVFGSKHVQVKGVDDKRQITATFGRSAVGEFLTMEAIYEVKRYKVW